MQITSNVGAVAARLVRLKNRDIPVALRTALAPGQWRELARKEAQAVLTGLAHPEQVEFIGAFVNTLVVDVFGSPGCFFQLRTPFPAAQTLTDYQTARSLIRPEDRGLNLFQKDITAFEQLMAEWVATEKNKDQRDAGKSDEDIGNWLAHVFLTPDGATLRVQNSHKKENIGRPVREVFQPYIEDFLQRKAAADRLDAATVSTWLQTVLASWRGLVRDLFPEIFHRALMAARSELAFT